MRSARDSIGNCSEGWPGMRKDRRVLNMLVSIFSGLGMHQGSTNEGREQHSPEGRCISQKHDKDPRNKGSQL